MEMGRKGVVVVGIETHEGIQRQRWGERSERWKETEGHRQRQGWQERSRVKHKEMEKDKQKRI